MLAVGPRRRESASKSCLQPGRLAASGRGGTGRERERSRAAGAWAVSTVPSMLSVDDELAQQEALLNEDVPNAPAAGAPEALADPAGDDDVDVDDDAGEEHFRRRANQPAGTEGTDAGMEEQTAEAGMDVEDGVPRVGQRKIIRRTLEPDGTVAAAGIDPTDPEELKRREARAEKFGLSEEQKVSKKREERMKKFGLDEPEPEPPAAPAMPLVNKVHAGRRSARRAPPARAHAACPRASLTAAIGAPTPHAPRRTSSRCCRSAPAASRCSSPTRSR